MRAFVLDCSVTMAWVFRDEATAATDQLRDSLRESRAYVPSLWLAEVGNVLLAATRRGRVRVDEWSRIRDAIKALPVHVDTTAVSSVLDASLDLAYEYNLSVYDAIYLELATRMTIPLATLDRALAAAGRAAGLDVPGLA